MTKKAASKSSISKNSTAEYFAKNLQQVGFSSPSKAVLTTLKEAVDNSLDACEEHGILPEILIKIKKTGKGTLKNTDRLLISVEDNGPGLKVDEVPMVFGEYLASSKFGKGRCSRGQQGIGISAATTWAVQTSATGAMVLTKTKGASKALSCLVVNDLKKNKGLLKDKKLLAWEKPHGTRVEFLIDGRMQLNGEGGVLAYLRGNLLLNPHLSLTYELPEMEPVTIERVSKDMPQIPEASLPHPHTMKLGEFISHARLFGSKKFGEWLKTGFSRVTDAELLRLIEIGKASQSLLAKSVSSLGTEEFEAVFSGIQEIELKQPSTQSVMSIGEDALSLSIQRLGEINLFAVVSRKPAICDFKPVQVEVAVARQAQSAQDADEPVSVLRFANRVPLQFDKAACAIVKAITTINWKAYGLKQSRSLLPNGPYIIAVSVISPFIKFKNASKETIDASDELVEEIRKALQQAGQKIAKFLRKELKARELETKTQHIEKFGPILVASLCRIVEASEERKASASEGLNKLLRSESKNAEKELSLVEEKLEEHILKQKKNLRFFSDEDKEIEQRRIKEEEKVEVSL